MKLGLAVTIYCVVCDRGFPGEAYIWTGHGWDTKTFLDRARPVGSNVGSIVDHGNGNEFTCSECLRKGLSE